MIERIYIYTLSYYHHQIGSMNYYQLFRVRSSWNNCMRCMSFYILMNSWYGRIASWDIRVLNVFAPNLALSLTCSITTMLGTLLMIDAQQICSHLYIFSVVMSLEGMFPHSVRTRRDPCVRVYAALTLPSPHPPFIPLFPSLFLPPSSLHEQKKIEQGLTWHSTWTKRGGIWTDA